jgi:response regulator of citrate/malate metabolism
MGPPDFQGDGTIPALGFRRPEPSDLTSNDRPCCASTRSVAQEGAVSFRELTMIEIREVIRRWQAEQGLRETAREVGLDRKTVRRYFAALDELGATRDC